MSEAVSQVSGRVAAIYARVSSERQREQRTIASQLAGLRELAAGRGLLIADELVFCDEGFSGATLIRPALERLRDRAAEGCFEVLLCHAPDRLARRYAYQVLLLEELHRAGVEVIFVRGGEQSGSPEDEVVREVFRRYTEEVCSIAEVARWLTEQQIPTRKGKATWDRSTVWGMLRNPAYRGQAAYGKTKVTDRRGKPTRTTRARGERRGRRQVRVDEPAERWLFIAVPPLVS